MMTYEQFKAGPPRQIMAARGLHLPRSRRRHGPCSSFRHHHAQQRGGRTSLRARVQPRRTRIAILLLTDFAHVADEIAAGEAYGNMTRCGGPFWEAFAACVLNADW